MWDRHFATFHSWESHQRRVIYNENWAHWEEFQEARTSEAFRFFEQQLKCNTLAIPISNPSFTWDSDNQHLPLDILEPIQSTEFVSLNRQSSTTAESQGVTLVGDPDWDGRPSLLTAVDLSNALTAIERPTAHSPSAPSAAPVPSKKVSIHPQAGEFPLWFQAAVRMGTSFIRVAAAGVPPAFSGHHSSNHAVIDEYYFWIVQGKRFSPRTWIQNADVGDVSLRPL